MALKQSGLRLSFPAILEQQYRLDTAPARVADLTLVTQSGVGLYILLDLGINGFVIQHTSWSAVLWQLGAVILTYAIAARFIAIGVPFRLREGAFLAICVVGTLSAILAIAAENPPVTLHGLRAPALFRGCGTLHLRQPALRGRGAAGPRSSAQ
jgi:hypothetical protein